VDERHGVALVAAVALDWLRHLAVLDVDLSETTRIESNASQHKSNVHSTVM
jgi:hypothetical protein